LARRIYRQLCGLVQRPSETSAVIAHFGRCWSGNKANPGTVYDPEVFRQVILPRLGTAKLSEIAGAAGCSKAYASDIRRGKWTPHVSTWKALARLARVDVVELGPSGVDSSLMEKVSCVG
jgi:transcriptional regulator with XRE-family HTH domain